MSEFKPHERVIVTNDKLMSHRRVGMVKRIQPDGMVLVRFDKTVGDAHYKSLAFNESSLMHYGDQTLGARRRGLEEPQVLAVLWRSDELIYEASKTGSNEEVKGWAADYIANCGMVNISMTLTTLPRKVKVKKSYELVEVA